MEENKSVQNRGADYTASALKSILGAVPIVGSALAEIVGNIIPNQRVDRLADFAAKLAEKVQEHEKEMIQKRLLEPEGTDILEEALWQSARALSEDRRKQIASMVKNGLTKEEVDLVETKKLLLLLNQLNDLEVLILYSQADRLHRDKAFMEKFGEAIKPIPAWIRAPQEQLDKHAISESLRKHLVQLGLLQPSFPFVGHKQMPEFDPFTGGFKNSGYQITLLGRLLLRSIDFYPEASGPKLPEISITVGPPPRPMRPSP